MRIRYNKMEINIGDFGKVFNICNLYILLWCIYFSQDVYSQDGSVIAQLALMANLMITLFTFVKAIVNGRMPFVLKSLLLLVLVLTIYGIKPIVYGETFFVELSGNEMPAFAYVRSIYISIVPIFTYYYFAQKGMLTEGSLCRWAPVFYIDCFAIFQANAMKIMEMAAGSAGDGLTNNCGYLFLALIPGLVFFGKRPLLQYTFLVVSAIMLLLAVKRGAILIGIITISWFMFCQFKYMSRKQRLIFGSFSSLFVVFVVVFFMQLLATDDYFFRRFLGFLDGNVSHRDILVQQLWNHFLDEENPIIILFGNGPWATLKITENMAHNDWLELLINQGVFGVLLYAIYWISYVLYLAKHKFADPRIKIALQTLFVIFFLKTFFSMSYADIAFVASPVFGYCFSQSYNDKKNETVHNIS